MTGSGNPAGRRQQVVLNGKFSSWENVLSGLPQGNVLGSPLFNIYSTDMDVDTVIRLISALKKFAEPTGVM